MPSLRCSVVDPAHQGEPVDLDVSAPDGTTWREVRAEVAAAAGLDDVPLAAQGQPVADDAALGHPPLLNGVLLVAARGPGAARPRGLLELHVVGGPDSGRIHLMAPGEHQIGRSVSAGVRLEDPDASRHHASLSVTADGVAVRDHASVNGTSVDGLCVGDDPAQIRPGQRIQVGRSTLVVRSPAVRLAAARATGRGTVEVNRAPRPAPTAQPGEVRRPAKPTASPAHRWPWLTMLLPLAVAVPIALLMRQPIFLLFALMSPVMVIGNVVSERSRGRREQREAHLRWQQETLEASARIEAALTGELGSRRAAAPDPAEVLRTVTRPTARLWERGPGSADVLDLLVGSGRVASDLRVSNADGAREPKHLDDAPVVVPLRAHGHLGIAGPRPQVIALARNLICQVAAWHGPRAVDLVVLACTAQGAAQWAWTRWLPHLRGQPISHLGQAQTLVAALVQRALDDRPGAAGPHTVLVIDSASTLRSLPGLADLLVVGPAASIHAICLDDDLAGLAGECRATLELRPDGGRLVTDGTCVDPVRWDGVGPGWAETVARALAGLRDATPETGMAALPADVRLLDLLEVDATDPTCVLAGWQRCAATTSVVVGVDADGPAAIDLRRDGPHALVAGTTGAGKSELLQTLVTSLAVANRPDELSFVLVDYKGGAAFRGCADLPHTAGLVTDLDEHLAERALTCLGAELTRRERVLAAAGCKDLDEYHCARRADPSLAPVARLVVVIDEFRLLAEELPSFVTGLVRVAAVGRSLGVHLVLATQRPAGIVGADIKANVNLRIALRVRDRADSDDVVDAPDAAGIDVALPGRALCRNGSGPLRALQVARVSGSAAFVDPDAVVVRRTDQPIERTAGPSQTEPDDLARIVAGLREATERGGIDPAPAAWLPPLPPHLSPAALAAGGFDDGVALGLVDLPAKQQQPVLRWHPVKDGHLGLCGGPRSGRTTALASIAMALSRFRSPADLHLHVIDAASGQLRELAALPHTGTVLTRDQPRLVARLVARLSEEVSSRLDRAAPLDPPPIVLLIDGWDALVESLDALDHGRTTEALTALLREGRAAGLRAVVAGDRALLTSRLTAVVPDRLLLRVTDPTDLLLAGLPGTSLAADPPPGRAIRTSDGAAIQLAAPCAHLDLGATLADEGAHPRWPGSPSGQLLRIRELPTSVQLDDIADDSPSDRRALLGVGGDEGRPVVLDLDAHPVFVVAGPQGSGRSTTLSTLARSLSRCGVPVIAICPRSSALDVGPWPVLGPLDERALIQLLADQPRSCVLVDDGELLVDGPIDPVLAAIVGQRGPAAVVLAGTTSALLGLFRGAAATARTARTGVILQPSAPSDGEVLGIRAMLPDRAGPGRGLLVMSGEQQSVQIAR